ncbi:MULTISPECIES: ABC transporter permease [unclassified Clostridioides]|uniref:ABC transporter permease n=1 Tax=unclassified Clostridioides TaxID=2635829 RepID=UPI001D10BDA3|nr:ABC transporter permease [Clostridioides sp. ES-S-0001-02]MCC0656002.1 ABC transporter permease [Clostridioides sp. ES-S-0123-01]MCC0673746.1 ABC transporter permease [Clostridioides sp. ES-S-0145-01]MCC0680768.1 ABC transporter permease [Clostridioides sp. ES-S-0005-03]MCC0694626.1 ABC transporter permease [Clostridioides sp. ES-S-0048-02]MCC0702812.1 ABC transporter permease [Clostridioides sp. ES-S-0049-02]UDN46978.1 ABC transporter permease [Clostridioides sp. ES-S-0173-01]UDN59041.1 
MKTPFKYLIRRILMTIPILIGITFLGFILGVIAPGDPAVEYLSMDGISAPTDEEIERVREELGLNDNIIVQYINWTKKAMTGDLGLSYIKKTSITEEILRRLPITFSLSLMAMFFVIVLSIPLAIIMALKKDSAIDKIGTFVSLLMISIPGFWLAIIMLSIFCENLRWLPTSGYGTIKHLIMPGFVLAAGTIGTVARLNRATLIESIGQNYITVAKAKGLSNKIVIFKYAFLNSLMPIVTVLGNYFGAILGGSTVVEVIFSIPGMGSYVIQGIMSRDYPVVQGYVLFTGIIFIVFNLIVDICYLFLNPKMRVGGK